MRLVDSDFAAASYLSSMKTDDLRDCELTGPGIQTLVRCDIERSDRKKDAPAEPNWDTLDWATLTQKK